MGDNDVFAAWEFAWEAYPGAIGDYYFVPHGGVSEVLHVFFDMKYQVVLGA